MNEPEQQNSANLVGRTIAGRYTIRATVGAGGMGFVYRAVQSPIEREVALKVLRVDLAHQDGIAERFTREARAASRINHPNAITIYEFGEDNGIFYLAMELLSGETLRQRLRREPPLEVDHALDIFEAMAGALAAAHRVGVVHRDLKPDNIFLAQFEGLGEVVKVLDFGLAKLLDRAPGDEGLVTDVNLRLGTPRYMAPEQALGLQPIDARCDVYALGLLLYEMLAGRAPFVGDDGMEVLAQRLRKEAPPLSQTAPARSFTPEMDALVGSLLLRDREKRPGDANEVIQRLRDLRRTGRVYAPVDYPSLTMSAEETALAPMPPRTRVPTGTGMPATRISIPSAPAVQYRPVSGQAPALAPNVAVAMSQSMPQPVAKVSQVGMPAAQFQAGQGPALADDFDKPTVVLGASLRGDSAVLDRRSFDGYPRPTPSEQTPRSPSYPLGTPAGGSRVMNADSMPQRGVFQTARARRLVVILLTAAAGAPLLALLYRECRPREPVVPMVQGTGDGEGEPRGMSPRPDATPLPVAKPVEPVRRPTPAAVPPDEPVKTDRPRQVAVKLQSTPSGAQVLRDGRPVGTTPLTENLPYGSTPVRYQLRAAGYQPYDFSFVPEHRRSFSFSLRREGSGGGGGGTGSSGGGSTTKKPASKPGVTIPF